MSDNQFSNYFDINAKSDSENPSKPTDRRKAVMVFMVLFLGQITSLLNMFTYNYFPKFLSCNYPLLFHSFFFAFFFIIWLLINRRFTEPKRYYYLIIFLETQSFFLRCLTNSIYQNKSIIHSDDEEIINNTTNIQNITNNNNKNNYYTLNDQIEPYIPSYIRLPTSFLIIFVSFFIFLRKKYYFRKRHYFSLFIGFIGIFLIIYYYKYNYYEIFSAFYQNFKLSSKIQIIIYTSLSCIFISISFIIQENFFKSGKEIYEFFPYKGFISMLIFLLESFCIGEFKYLNKDLFTNKNVIIKFFIFLAMNGVYVSVIPFLIKQITSIMVGLNLMNYLFYYYLFYLDKKLFMEKKTLYLIAGVFLILVSFYVFMKFKINKDYTDIKDKINEIGAEGLVYSSSKYDINKSDSVGNTNVEMNLQMSNSPLEN